MFIDYRNYTETSSAKTLSNTLFDLNYMDIIRVKGERAKDFLQGQLSCDINEVNEQCMKQGALCNLQGRIISLMDVLIYKNDLHLLLPQDLIEKTLKVLSKPALFSHVKLTQNTSLRIFGFHQAHEEDLTPFSWVLPIEPYTLIHDDKGLCYALGQNTYIIVTEQAYVDRLIAPFQEQESFMGSFDWHILRLNQQQFEIYPSTSGLFLPHRLNLHLSGYLSFNKGCYRGQEIIARTHYRATLKHTLKTFEIESSIQPQVGTAIQSLEKREIGELIDFYPLQPNRYFIIASMLFEHEQEALMNDERITLFPPQ